MKNQLKVFFVAFTAIVSAMLSSGVHAQCPNVIWADEFNGTALDQINGAISLVMDALSLYVVGETMNYKVTRKAM